MATRGVYLTRNNVRSLFPCAEIDMSAMVAAGALSSETVSLNGVTKTAYVGYFKTAVSSWLTGGITDPRSDRQLYYFNADYINDCYESVDLTDEPDDYWITGLDSPGTGRTLQVCYYTGSQFSQSSPRMTCALNQTQFAPGTYLYNNSMCCVCRTDNDYFFGGSINNVYSPMSGYDYYQLDMWYVWRNNYYGLDESLLYTTAPQYGLQVPGVSVFPSNTRVYWISPGLNNVPNPPTPTDVISELVISEYGGETFVGICWHKIDAGGQLTGDNMHTIMLPLDFWGEIVPYTEPTPPPPEPGDFGPVSEPDAGGDGTYTDTNDSPVIPTPFSYTDTFGGNGVHLYVIDAANYGAVLDALWGTGSLSTALWTRWQNYKFNPLQGIVSSHYIPTELLPSTGTSAVIRMAGVDLTPHTAAPCTTQIGSHSLGTLAIPEFFGSALDYSPYTQMRLFLPFCGWIDIDPDRVVGGSLAVTYLCDAVSGDVCAYVICTDRTGTASYMYTATGNCAVTLPVTGNDQGTGQVLSSLSGAVMGAVMGNPLGVAGGLIGAVTAQHHMQQTGSFSGSVSLISDLTCRLQIIRPVQSTPKYGQLLRGRPSDIGCLIGDLIGTGWTAFAAVHADIDGATQAECDEIVRLLTEGVIL